MPAYDFQKQFASRVASGQKRQTIRATGKRRHARSSDALQLYMGMRTKACRKLVSPDPLCREVLPITMCECNGIVFIHIDGKLIDDAEALAVADGFRTLGEFLQFFRKTHGLPFQGVLIRW